jgi:hypothetical protein
LDDIGLRFFALSWIYHRLSDAQNADRVEVSQHMLDMMQGLGSKQQKYLITGTSPGFTGTIIVAECGHDRDELPPNVKRTISSTKTMAPALFSRCGFVSLEFLPIGQKFNSKFFTETVLSTIERKLAEFRPRL